tara:strand:+ start:242 stop:682 length:441 start_codon:yes stop_codon:yes gene_type:complete
MPLPDFGYSLPFCFNIEKVQPINDNAQRTRLGYDMERIQSIKMTDKKDDNQIDLEDAIKYVNVQISEKSIVYLDPEESEEDTFSDHAPQSKSYEQNQKMIAEAKKTIQEATNKEFPYNAVVNINGVMTYIETTSKEALKKYIDKSL